MPYPAKTSAGQILDLAVVLLEQDGQAGLSLRALAAALRLTPNALYRYYPSREALLAAVAAQGAAWLHAELQQAPNLPDLAHRYLAFARARPALYDLYMTCDSLSPQQMTVYGELWDLVVAKLTPLAGAQSPQAAVTLWGYLHGMVGLERSGVYDDPTRAKPRDTTDFGLNVLLTGLTALKPEEQ